MSARSFRSVFMVASCAGAALGCYLVSLRVASERSQLEDVETRIVLAQRDMRVLQTEIGTRGRLAQLERWNARVLALSAPAANQFVSGGYELAKLTRTQPQVDFQAPVVLASAPAPERAHAPIGEESHDDAGAPTATADLASPGAMLHQASLKIEPREVQPRVAPEVRPQAPRTASGSSVRTPKAVQTKAAAKKSVDKPAVASVRPVTKPVQLAKNDPLAPLPGTHLKKTAKDTGSAR